MKPTTTPKQRRPQVGMEIVWRFKDNKGWRSGCIRGVVAQGKVIEITEGRFSSWGNELVALADIDWHIK